MLHQLGITAISSSISNWTHLLMDIFRCPCLYRAIALFFLWLRSIINACTFAIIQAMGTHIIHSYWIAYGMEVHVEIYKYYFGTTPPYTTMTTTTTMVTTIPRICATTMWISDWMIRRTATHSATIIATERNGWILSRIGHVTYYIAESYYRQAVEWQMLSRIVKVTSKWLNFGGRLKHTY